MTIIVLHYHLRPGGVRRVIELGIPALVAHAPEKVRRVVLATGEAPEAGWLKDFRRRLAGTPVEVLVEPAFGYTAESRLKPKELEKRVANGVLDLVTRWRRDGAVVWAHNLGLGRNLILARDLPAYASHAGCPVVAHHHDWWFDNRWHLLTNLQAPGFRKLDAVARAIFAARHGVAHAAINQADFEVLAKHFPQQTGWLPNPVEPPRAPPAARVAAARAWLTAALGDAAPVWLVPCRLLRRKNLAEALLLTRWLRPGAWLVTTGGVSSAEEAEYATALAAAAQTHGWRLRLGVLAGQDDAAPSVPELLAASEAALLTSLVEGFGLPYLEAAAARRPLLARRLPNIAPDLAQFGFKFPQSYAEVRVASELFDWEAERARQRERFAVWRDLMPRTVQSLVGRPALLAAARPGPVPFSRLTLTAQIEVLAHPGETSWAACAPLNPGLCTWQTRAAQGRLQVSPWPRSAMHWLGGAAYSRRFFELVQVRFAWEPSQTASSAVQNDFLRRKLRAENLYPLLWNSIP